MSSTGQTAAIFGGGAALGLALVFFLGSGESSPDPVEPTPAAEVTAAPDAPRSTPRATTAPTPSTLPDEADDTTPTSSTAAADSEALGHLPTFDEVPEEHRPEAMAEAAEGLAEILEGQEGLEGLTVGQPDCDWFPCLVPIGLAAKDIQDDGERFARVMAAAVAIGRVDPIQVSEWDEDGTRDVHLYWHFEGMTGEQGHYVQVHANERVMGEPIR